jgi:hypothetical protein
MSSELEDKLDKAVEQRDTLAKIVLELVQANKDTSWNLENDFGRCGTSFYDDVFNKYKEEIANINK